MIKAAWSMLITVVAALVLTVIWLPRSAPAQGITALTAGKPGDPVPTLTQTVGGTDGTNTRMLAVDATGAVTATSRGVGFNNVVATQRFCDRIANMTTLGATATVLQITGVAAQNIYICGMVLNASTATAGTTLVMTTGTGAACGTGTATAGALLQATPTASPTTPQIASQGPAVRVTTTAGDSLCFTQGQAVNSTAVSGTIFYTIG